MIVSRKFANGNGKMEIFSLLIFPQYSTFSSHRRHPGLHLVDALANSWYIHPRLIPLLRLLSIGSPLRSLAIFLLALVPLLLNNVAAAQEPTGPRQI